MADAAGLKVTVRLPPALVELHRLQGGDLCLQLGRALAAGIRPGALGRELRGAGPSPAAPGDAARDGLVFYFGSLWYLANEVALLQRQLAEQEQLLEELTAR